MKLRKEEMLEFKMFGMEKYLHICVYIIYIYIRPEHTAPDDQIDGK